MGRFGVNFVFLEAVQKERWSRRPLWLRLKSRLSLQMTLVSPLLARSPRPAPQVHTQLLGSFSNHCNPETMCACGHTFSPLSRTASFFFFFLSSRFSSGFSFSCLFSGACHAGFFFLFRQEHSCMFLSALTCYFNALCLRTMKTFSRSESTSIPTLKMKFSFNQCFITRLDMSRGFV